MPYLFILWFIVAGTTAKGIKNDLTEERQTVKLFRQSATGYESYFVKVNK